MDNDYLIITASDSKYGDFLINDWFASLKDNVNLTNTDILILDYGLTKEQIRKIKKIKLDKSKIIIKQCKRDGHVNIIRLRDALSFLKKRKYKQVLFIDGGDIIFCDDFSKVWTTYPDYFRGVYEDSNESFSILFTSNAFDKITVKKIRNCLKNKKIINIGVLFAPYNKAVKVFKEAYALIKDKTKFGPDQIAINYILQRDKIFKEIEKRYNFVIASSKSKFKIIDNMFYLEDGKKIAIVHNAGNLSFLRPIKNFGYKKDVKVKRFTIFCLKLFFFFSDNIKRIIENLKK